MNIVPFPDYYLGMKKASFPVQSSQSAAASRTVDQYLAGVPEPARSTLNKVRAIIRGALPVEATEIISYRIPAFKYKKVLIWYAAFAGHCSLFPTASVIEKFKDELSAYRVSKGTIHFPVDKPMPAALLKKIVKARLAEMEGSC
jgi:uncharacterized protein YdhG (YjbR/CyaY superfamily)